MSTPDQVAGDLSAWATFTRDATHKVVTVWGALLHTAVKRRAAEPRTNPRPSDAPEGPRLLTGNYSRSINRRTTRFAGRSISEVGTNAIQGPRLELGFHGTDAAGRNVNARPYPHFGPALDEIGPKFEAALDGVLAPPGHGSPTAGTIAPRITP